MQQLFQHLNGFYKLSQEALAALEASFEELILPKGAFLVTHGNVCRHMYFLQKGALRGFYNLEGKEITHWFGFENDFITSFHSFITGEPAVENLQLLEGSILYSISKEKLTGLFNRHHEIERLVRIVYEKYYIRLEERYVNAQFKTATERYEALLKNTPHIIERVSLGYISSYLGISQETLSRIRSRL
ncbi:MAG: Crp/Fnr family transcriptional regulator [Chitinophagaceae bacterium]|nr:Crp/Fnr family transcriptional regulator [Chitinophagaceae bacterium]